MTARETEGFGPQETSEAPAPPENESREGVAPDAEAEFRPRSEEVTYRINTVMMPETPVDVGVNFYMGHGQIGFSFSKKGAEEFAMNLLDMAERAKELEEQQRAWDAREDTP